MPNSTSPAASAAAPALTDIQKRTAQAIVNIFETGAVLGLYGQVTVISGDTGHLTFGRSQTTLGSGNLAKLITTYCANPGARFAARLAPWQTQLDKNDTALDNDFRLHNLLRATADDPVMRGVQDKFFDDTYWAHAVREAAEVGLATPLGMAVVYDSVVHGSWPDRRDDTNRNGSVKERGEAAWIKDYIAIRRKWLAGHARADLHATVYRMDALKALADAENLGLSLPIVVRDLEISEQTLNGRPPGCYDGPQLGSRPLSLDTPLARGLDVRLLQLGLSDKNISVKADGVFGSGSMSAVKEYQQSLKLAPTGVADLDLLKSFAS